MTTSSSASHVAKEPNMQFGRAFSFVFEDPDWLKKVGIAALVSLIPLVGQIFLIGWGIEVMRRVIAREAVPLPDWNDFSGHLLRGLKAAVVYLVYSLPMILFGFCMWAGMMGSTLLLAGDNSNGEAATIAVAVVASAVGCLMLIYGLLMAFLLPAGLARMATTGNLGDAFRIGEVFKLVRAAPGPYVLAILGSILAGIIGSLGSIACGIGAVFTGAYAGAITGHLYGQAYLAAREAKPATTTS
jgi:Protein of unknown function (DUF4013)